LKNKIKIFLLKTIIKQNLTQLLLLFTFMFFIIQALSVIYYNKNIKEVNLPLFNPKKIINKKSQLYFLYNNLSFSADLIIINKKKYILKNIPIRTISFYEKLAYNDNIDYKWITKEKLLKLFPDLKKYFNNKKKKEILFFNFEILYKFFTFFLILYIIEKSGFITFGLNKKFNIIFPDEIKGDLNDLIGLKEIKQNIQSIKYMLKTTNKSLNIMFSGPPGTGKTKMASYISKELNIPMIIGTGNVETGYVAGGANTIKSLFKSAYFIASLFNNKCLVFLDEAQILLKERNSNYNNSSKWDDDTTNELLSNLDGINTKNDKQIIFIMASNFDETNMKIDEAVERRFQQKIYFRLPIFNERKELFELYLKKENININKIDINYLAEITQNFSPAKIETIIKECLLQNNYNKSITTEKLIKTFEIITLGHITKDITKDKEKERKIITIHELGHFICYLDLLAQEYKGDLNKIIENFKILKISTESIAKYNALGFVINIDKDNNLKTVKELENEIIKLYGGVASEEYFLKDKNITIGSYNDIEKITEILNLLINKLNVYKKSKINFNLLYTNNDLNIKEMEKKAEELYNKSFEIIKKNKQNILFLKNILLKQWTLNKNELIELIKLNKIKIK